jgi:hypothetical protein
VWASLAGDPSRSRRRGQGRSGDSEAACPARSILPPCLTSMTPPTRSVPASAAAGHASAAKPDTSASDRPRQAGAPRRSWERATVPRPGAWLLVFVHSERLASRDPDASFRVNPEAPDPRSFPADVSGDTTEVALLGLRREGGHVQGRAHRPRRVGARSNRPGSWALLLEALEGDISDVQGGTTAEGVHLGAMSGTLDLLQRGLTGSGGSMACCGSTPSCRRSSAGSSSPCATAGIGGCGYGSRRAPCESPPDSANAADHHRSPGSAARACRRRDVGSSPSPDGRGLGLTVSAVNGERLGGCPRRRVPEQWSLSRPTA